MVTILRRKLKKYFSGMRLKIFMTYMSIVLLILVLLNYLPAVMTRDVILQEKQVELYTSANIVANTMVSKQQELAEQGPVNTRQATDGQEVALTNLIAQDAYNLLRFDSSQRLMVCDTSMKVIFDSAYRNNIEGRYLMLQSLYDALQGKSGFTSKIGREAYEFAVSVPVTNQGKVAGAVYIYEYSTDRARLIGSTNQYIFLLSILILVVAVSLSFVFTNLFTEQIKAINTAVRNMKAGIYDKKAKIISRDELGELADQFNQLSDRLWETEEQRRQFISNASHELKTPLAAIKLLSDSILENEMDEATTKEFLTDINGEIDRMTRLTEQLLKLSKMDSDTAPSPKSQPVDLSEIVDRVAKVLSQLMEKRGIRLECQLDRECRAQGDEDRIYQIVMNLMENATKYNRDNGKITVKVSAKGNKAILIVEDTGIGIAREDLDRIFERFYRVDKARSRQTGGTGLGLSIVKDNVESMGAKIRAYSKLGRGTAFVVEFSRAHGEESRRG